MLKSSHPAAHTLCFQVSCKGAEGAPLIPVPSLVSSESPYFCQALLGPLRPRPDPWGVSDLSKPHVGQVLSYKVQLHLSHKWPLTCHHPPPLTRPTAAPTDQGHPEPTLNLFCVPVWGGGGGGVLFLRAWARSSVCMGPHVRAPGVWGSGCTC